MLWGSDDSAVFKRPNSPGDPLKQIRQPQLLQRSEPGYFKEKLQMESTSIGRPQTLECQRFVMVVSMVCMVGEVESVAHL